MSDKRIGTDVACARFYSQEFTTVLFNIYAVKNRLFRELLCESCDPAILARWKQAEPLILEAITTPGNRDAGGDRTHPNE